MSNSAIVNRITATDLTWEHTCKLCCFKCVTTMLLLVNVLVAIHNNLWLLLLLFEHVEALACCLEGLARLR